MKKIKTVLQVVFAVLLLCGLAGIFLELRSLNKNLEYAAMHMQSDNPIKLTGLSTSDQSTVDIREPFLYGQVPSGLDNELTHAIPVVIVDYVRHDGR